MDAADVVLVAVTDLNRRERRLVEALGDRATALVVAGADTRDRFDALGCVRPDAWRDAPIEIGDDEVVVADRPIDQGQAVLHAMAALDGDVGPGSITIALGDESLAPTLMRAGTTAGVRFHHAAGAPLARSAPARLLASVADWIEHRSYPALAALVRHPDVEQWLRRVTAARRPEDAGHDWIAELDRSFDAHRPARLGDRWPGRDARAGRIRWGLGVIDRWLRPLGGPPAPLGTWPDRILAVLREVYGGAEIATARRQPLEAAATALRDGLRAVSSAPASLQPPTDGLSALRVCLHEMETVAVPVEPHGDEVEMLGWLEVALDPAPVVVVTGFNDGHVPGAVNADAFLPEGLRERAGLLGNARRFARDAWILDTVRRGRRATLVAGRRSAEGEPLTPSRLLLAGADRARRVLALADERAVFAPPRGIGVPAPVETSTFTVPAAPTEGVELDRISVTDFRRYLQCPFRYWLERVLRLEAVDDTADELDALRFGTLAHGVLQDFGEDPDVRDLDDPDRIESFLLAALDARAADAFGDLPAPAVRIQIARLRRRLSVFAARQAARRRAGWRIERAEHVLPETARLDVPGQADVRVTGKVDRVDRHEETGAWLVIDYKTGEKARTPEKAHRDGARWTDLQLPLYRHLLAADGVDGEVGLAYFCLPGTLKEIEILEAGWSPEEIDEAVDVARGVVRDIRAGKFERNPDFPLHYRDAFETICQTRVFGAGEELEWAGADA
ncbi:MAG: PD-(D/E)XK nuclease family protein [Planctomycetota bacterium]